MQDTNLDLVSLEDDALLEDGLKIEVTAEKSFNKCLTCQYFRSKCSGPNLNAMTVQRVCEFLQLCRLQLGLTYLQVAERADISEPNVKRILTGKIKNPGFLSIQALTFVLVCPPDQKNPCAMPVISEEANRAIADCKAAQAALAVEERKLTFLKDQIEFDKQQLAEKDRQLRDRYDYIIMQEKKNGRVVRMLTFLLAACLGVIIAMLALR